MDRSATGASANPQIAMQTHQTPRIASLAADSVLVQPCKREQLSKNENFKLYYDALETPYAERKLISSPRQESI